MGDGIICAEKGVNLKMVLQAIREDSMTVEEIAYKTGACGMCPGCRNNLSRIIEPICDCLGVSVFDIAQAMKHGADSLEKAVSITGAGAVCGRCKERIAEIYHVLKRME